MYRAGHPSSDAGSQTCLVGLLVFYLGFVFQTFFGFVFEIRSRGVCLHMQPHEVNKYINRYQRVKIPLWAIEMK